MIGKRLLRSGLVLLAFAVVLARPAPAAASPVLFAVTFSNQLITIDTATGAGTLVGALDSAMAAFGLGSFGGALYTYDQIGDRLRQLDPNTGGTLSSLDLGLGDLLGEGGVSFRSDGVGFLTSTGGINSNIYSFTLAAGSGVFVGSTSDVAGLDGLAFSSSNVLFALGQSGQDNLYTVSQTTGALTLIGPTGVVGSSALGGLDFLGATLYAVINNSLYTLNTTTGAATQIGATGFTDVSGIAFADLDQTEVPEPASMVLLGLGLIALAARRRRA